MTQPSRRRPTLALGPAALGVALGWPGVGLGATASDGLPANAPLLRAAIVVTTFDHYADACRQSGRFSPAQRREIETWNDRQRVAEIRTAMRDLRRRTPEQAQQVEQAANQVVGQVDSRRLGPCEAAVRITRTADAQFAAASPSPFAEAPAAAAARPAPSTRAPRAVAERSTPEPAGGCRGRPLRLRNRGRRWESVGSSR